MYVRKIMTDTTKHAMETMMRNVGGPFGAAIVKNGEVICVESNSVLRDKDPHSTRGNECYSICMQKVEDLRSK